MAKKKLLDIDEIIKRKLLVEYNRKPFEKPMLFGFVLACNDEFTLIHEFDRSYFRLDGYCIFRNDSVKAYSVYDEESYFLNEVIRFKKIRPKPVAKISIKSWAEILQTVSENFSLIRIEREKINNKACQIGKLKEVKKKSFTLEEVDTHADWDGSFKYKFKDLTKVGFDDLYVNTLALVVESREKQNSK